jgi:hypothetical protein
VAVGLVALAVVRAGTEDAGPAPPDRLTSAWKPGQPVSIAVAGGRASFGLPTTAPGQATLVVVSALSRQPGPYPIRLSARAATHPKLPKEAVAPPPRRASIAMPTLGPIPEPSAAMPPKRRTFHMMVGDGDALSASNYLAVEGRLRAVGHRVQVYVDSRDEAAVGPEVLRDLVLTFDDQVFPVAARTFGLARDIDGDGRFTVLMSSWLGGLAGGRHAVDGFVRGADLDPSLGTPFSNRCDMMYLNTALEAGPHLRTVLAHEYTHAATYTAKSFAGPGGARIGGDEEGWLDEALAHLGEDLHGFSRTNLDYRVSAFLSRPERYQLVVDDYFTADLFRSHGNRGGTYLFLRWCADRFGPGLLPALVRSPRRGTANLEAATGVAFAELYRQWSVALFLSGFDPDGHQADGYGFRSLDVRGPFDDWELAGPRTVRIRPGGAADAWEAAGTSSHFVVIEGAATGAIEVEVAGSPEAELQVTAVPLPADLARIELSAQVAPGPDGDFQLHLKVSEVHGTAVRLSSIAWEPLVPAPDPHAPGFRRDGLDMAGIAAAFGTSALPVRGRLQSRPIALTGVHGPIVVKAVGTDALGRRVAAWADVVPPDPETDGDPL